MLYSSELEFVTVWLVGGITGVISAVGFLLASALYYAKQTRLREAKVSPKFYAPIHKNPVFKYRALRVLTCSAFLALTLVSFVRAQSTHPRQVAVASASIVYITCLSVLSVVPSPALSAMANRHANALLLSLFSVYAYRDIWPLFTFDKRSIDIDEGQILWLKVAALGIAAIAIPFACPNQAYPATMDQLNPETTNPEEHASLLSLFTHSYSDSFIFERYRTKTPLTVDQLPPLANADHSDAVMPRILSILDPPSSAERPYLFWGLLRAYRRRVCVLAFLNILQFALTFVAPISIKQVLSYLENNGEGATIRPWVWVSGLFLGPFLKAIFSQLLTYMACRNNVQISGVLNQLLLRHALKIRTDSGHHPREQKEKSNFTGRLNNLAASDAAEVAGRSDYWIVFVSFPLELALCLWFLYAMLKWRYLIPPRAMMVTDTITSAMIGFAFILLCVPVPRYIAEILRGIETKKKYKTDARIQTVTEGESLSFLP
ncbi:hypothetical protein D9757_003439 [Collybiopsis confluens]|uniref:Uncharacterized protein n=1 Tax=Collybiopsis confluens TaxID=2823264 RepID=A0A8H5MCR0_9AGAR|nr:hypothetical protein D9757_003439 [Collybiopsis confluens]